MSSGDGLVTADPYATYIRNFAVYVVTLDLVWRFLIVPQHKGYNP